MIIVPAALVSDLVHVRFDVRSTPEVIGHRGASAEAPENTMLAFEAAWAAGCTWIEADVQPTADNVPVMLHDDDLSRTTDGSGALRHLSAEEVGKLDAGSWFRSAKGVPYAGTAVPNLAEVVEDLSASRALLLEIKGQHTREQVAAELAVIRASRWDERVFVESFQVEVLRHVHAIEPGRPVGLLVHVLHEDPVAVCAELGVASYNPDHRVLRERPEVVEQLHEAGVAVTAFTADHPEDWEFLTDLRVDGIITNIPADLLAWQATNCA